MRPVLGFAPGVAGLLVALALVMLSLADASQSEAGSLVVTTMADSGPGSFRQALANAGTNPGLDVITFDPAVFPEANPATIQATRTTSSKAAPRLSRSPSMAPAPV